MTSLVVSVDELRAAVRLAGVPVPPAAGDDDPDDPRVDLAALRGLAARGLIVGLSEGDPEPAGVLATALAAFDEPDWILDVELDELDRRRESGDGRWPDGHREHRRWNSYNGPHGAASAMVLLGGLMQVDLDGVPDSAVDLAARCGLPEESGRPAAEGQGDLPDASVGGGTGEPDGFEVTTAAHVEADALALAGELAAATAALAEGGARRGPASRWVEAVASHRSAVAVRVARRVADLAIEERELRWLVGGDHRVWQVDGDDDVSRVRVVSADDVRAALADLLPPAALNVRRVG